MAVARYPDLDTDFLNKYATFDYYLSRGASGNVYGPIPWNSMQLAIKQVMFADGKVTEEFKKDLEVKKDIWTSLEHKHLMGINSVDLNRLPKVMFIVMEFAAGGSLSKALRSLGSGNSLPNDVVTDWANQIADGMLYLHEKNIVHRDLKSSNILLMEPFDDRNPHVTLKITDCDDIKEHDHTTTMSTLVGTCVYMAPEVLVNQWFSKASDVWSFGVVIWEMLSGDIPHKGLETRTIIFKSQAGKLDNLPLKKSFPEDYKLILSRCWKSTRKERLLFSEIFCVLQRMAEGKDVTEILKFKGNMLQKYFRDTTKVSDIAAAENKDTSKRSSFKWRRSIRDKVPKGLERDELPEKYKSDPDIIGTIRATAAKAACNSITGLTILDKELFVVCEESSEIEVCDSIKLNFSGRWNLTELIDPKDIVSCNINKCLYIFDFKESYSQSKEILRVDPHGNLINKWSTGDEYGCSLSVTDKSNVILTVYNKNKLNEYSPDGLLFREIYLSSEAGRPILYPFHAIQMTNGHFVVSHSSHGDDLHRVCIVDTDGKIKKSFGGKRGSTIEQMKKPVHLSVDGNGFVMVTDQGNIRVLLLDSNLEFKREILSAEKHGLQCPLRIFPDESNGRLFVADNEFDIGGRMLIFKFCA